MSTPDEPSQEKPKVIVRRRPAGANPPPVDDSNRWSGERNYWEPPKPRTGHDLYLTYDINGKLRTHTVYHSPVDPRTIVQRPGKKKKNPEPPTEPKENNPA